MLNHEGCGWSNVQLHSTIASKPLAIPQKACIISSWQEPGHLLRQVIDIYSQGGRHGSAFKINGLVVLLWSHTRDVDSQSCKTGVQSLGDPLVLTTNPFKEVWTLLQKDPHVFSLEKKMIDLHNNSKQCQFFNVFSERVGYTLVDSYSKRYLVLSEVWKKRLSGFSSICSLMANILQPF